MPPYDLTLKVPVAIAVNPTGGTIAATGTFQVALAANDARKGGIIQNNSTANAMYVFANDGTATEHASLQVPHGQTIDLSFGQDGHVYTGEVQITGTTADVFGIVEFT